MSTPQSLVDDAALLADGLARRDESVAWRNLLGEAAFVLMQRRRYVEAMRVFDAIVGFTDLMLTHYCNALWVAQRDNTRIEVDAARSRRYLVACLPHAARNPAIHLNAAGVYAELDEPDAAIEQLLQARAGGVTVTPFLDDPLFAPLAHHARWAELASPMPAPPVSAPAIVSSAAPAGAPDSYATLLALVRDHLTSHFLPFDARALDEGRVDIKLAFRKVRRFELEALARRCQEIPRAQWSAQVREWLRFAGGPAGAPLLVPREAAVPADSIERGTSGPQRRASPSIERETSGLRRRASPSIEPELESFLLRSVPALADTWRGASDEEIDALEQTLERPLPRCYRWFLSRMGRGMGPLALAKTDFGINAVRARVEPGQRHLTIGVHAPDVMDLDTLYDLDRPARDDAQVENASGGPEAETLREWLAWLAMMRFQLTPMPSRRSGHVESQQPDTLERLTRVLQGLGFSQPVAGGARQGLFERRGAAMAARSWFDLDPRQLSFWLGCSDEEELQRILGAIQAALTLDVRSVES